MRDFLAEAYPELGRKLPKLHLADLPTPLTTHELTTPSDAQQITVKHDERTSSLYGGNKVRKLEYLLKRAVDRGARRVATFGSVGSHHALATAIHARALGLDCTCFLAHQKRVPGIAGTLNMHLALGTEIVRYGGDIDARDCLRRHLHGRNAWVIPLGGSNWLGAVGYVVAALELDAQLAGAGLPPPTRIYVANGTMATAAGLALGLAAAGRDIDVHAVRVADNRYANPARLSRLVARTAALLGRLDASFDPGLARRARIVWRDDFFAGGYAVSDAATEAAIGFAATHFGLALDGTYTGKACAALRADLESADGERDVLYWHTLSSAVLPVDDRRPPEAGALPAEFLRYFD